MRLNTAWKLALRDRALQIRWVRRVQGELGGPNIQHMASTEQSCKQRKTFPQEDQRVSREMPVPNKEAEISGTLLIKHSVELTKQLIWAKQS